MKLKEKLAEDFVKSFALQLPGSFDFTEGVNCYKAGFEQAKQMSIDRLKSVLVGFKITQGMVLGPKHEETYLTNLSNILLDIGEEEVQE